MTRVLVAAALFLSLWACAPLTDERWEGQVTDCSDGIGDSDVIVLLNRAGSSVPGYAGFKVTNAEEVYAMTLIEDPEYGPGTLKFTATYDLGNGSEDWTVDLTSEGGQWTGELEREVNGNTVRCDLELELAE